MHTKLDVNFDWKNRYLSGKATIDLTPYFYPVNNLELDAKGFIIERVALLKEKNEFPLKYKYDNKIISIELDREYKKGENYSVYIVYTARPDLIEVKGSEAITSDKGLYFINPDGTDAGKPQQIWTQGETESSSCWFPTIDIPNERMTQEIFMTVENKYVTLSNGLLQFSTENGDGTRTDHWKQDLPHAPYLAMMAVGEYTVVKDKWKNIEVNYYVESDYAQYAKDIFGKTPEMLQFFSDVLGVEYPWEKYHQVVVRDYVSGAMENTGAVIFGEYVQKSRRELLDDNTGESVVSHELFHHWFGDLVTCESWSNLPLNESFATYGEYLWDEYKYGRDEADFNHRKSLFGYLRESKDKKENLIRFNYDDKEDMFDGHSYNKGGQVLHMLRKYTGDEAFFSSLKHYLTTHKFSSVEIHDLRLSFEKITGEDLNWFFNQWFLSKGHPVLSITHHYNDSTGIYKLKVEQNQDTNDLQVFRLPVQVDIYWEENKRTEKIIIDKSAQTFEFKTGKKPLFVNFDSEKNLLCTRTEEKSTEEWANQFYKAPLYLDRFDALSFFVNHPEEKRASDVLLKALDDPYWNIRLNAVKYSESFLKKNEESFKKKIIQIAKTDKKSAVRGQALEALKNYYNESFMIALLDSALLDSSYYVISQGLSGLIAADKVKALATAKKLENETNFSVAMAIADIYAQHGSNRDHEFFQNKFKKLSGREKAGMIEYYTTFLKNQDLNETRNAIPVIREISINGQEWWLRYTAISGLIELKDFYGSRNKEFEQELKKAKTEKNISRITEVEKGKAENESMITLLDSNISEIKKLEKDKKLLRIYGE